MEIVEVPRDQATVAGREHAPLAAVEVSRPDAVRAVGRVGDGRQRESRPVTFDSAI